MLIDLLEWPWLGRFITGFLLFCLMITAGLGWHYYQLSQDSPGQSPDSITEQSVVEQAQQLIILPTDEQPYVSFVREAAQFRDRPFMDSAEDGDAVLLFPKAGFLVVYRPSVQKIVTTGLVETTGEVPVVEASGSSGLDFLN